MYKKYEKSNIIRRKRNIVFVCLLGKILKILWRFFIDSNILRIEIRKRETY